MTWSWPDTLVLVGQVDAAVIRRFSHLDRLAQVRVVDLWSVTSLDASAAALLLRCVQQVQRQHPGRRLQVVGTSPGIRAGLDVMAFDTFVDFVDLDD